MTEPSKPILPPTYFLVALLLIAALHVFFPGVQWFHSEWRYLGVLPILAGLAVSIHGSNLFDRHGTTIKPFQESSTLVVDGAFRYSRNPMYLAMVSMLAGTAIVLGTLTPWAIVVGFIFVITKRFIEPEEASLLQTFGEEYEAYRSKVGRWF